MSLGNMNNSQYFCWYAAAYNTKISNFSNVTSSEFGKGKYNTEIMMKIWENKTYGDLNTNKSFKDLWGFTKKYYNQNWFIPSSKEIAAFADQLKITKNNYLEKIFHIGFGAPLFLLKSMLIMFFLEKVELIIFTLMDGVLRDLRQHFKKTKLICVF